MAGRHPRSKLDTELLAKIDEKWRFKLSGPEKGVITKGVFSLEEFSRVSKISKFSRISRKWSDYPFFSTVWEFSRISTFSRISRKGILLKRPLFQKTPFSDAEHGKLSQGHRASYKGDAPKVTEANLRFPAVFCENLRFPAPSKCLNFQEKGWICENLRFSAKICVLGSLCHLSSVTLSAPWQPVPFSRGHTPLGFVSSPPFHPPTFNYPAPHRWASLPCEHKPSPNCENRPLHCKENPRKTFRPVSTNGACKIKPCTNFLSISRKNLENPQFRARTWKIPAEKPCAKSIPKIARKYKIAPGFRLWCCPQEGPWIVTPKQSYR